MTKLNILVLFFVLIAGFDVFADSQLVLTDRSYGIIQFGSKLLEIETKLSEKAKTETGDIQASNS